MRRNDAAMNHALTTGLLVLTFLMLSGCGRHVPRRIARESAAMNTYVTVTVFSETADSATIDRSIDAALAEIRRVEAMATDYADSSEVGRINAAAGRDTVTVSAGLAALLHQARTYADASGGAFDPTVGPLVKKWDFLSAHPAVPDSGSIAALLRLVGFRLMSLDGRNVYLPRRGMAIDLGAIAKGYAVDCAVRVLRSQGVQHCIVDLGGNLGVWWEGTHMFDSTAATIFVRHPRIDDALFGKFLCGSAGISTSGDYQRFFMDGGRRYHHILNPATGYPARGAVSVTVVARDATTADALSTLVFVLGRDRGMQFLRGLPGVEGMIICDDGDSLGVVSTPGMEAQFERFGVGNDRHD